MTAWCLDVARLREIGARRSSTLESLPNLRHIDFVCTGLEDGIVELSKFKWDKSKDKWLRATRNVGFEDVVSALADGSALADIQNPGRPNQRMIVFRAQGYVHVAPYVVDGEVLFFKTIYPDRKLNIRYRELP